MRSHNELLECYQKVVKLSELMLALASSGQWDNLIECEIDYLQSVERVAQNRGSKSLSPALQMQIRRYLEQIMENETQLKKLLNNRMDQLRMLIESSSQQCNINNTYGKISGNVLFPNEL